MKNPLQNLTPLVVSGDAVAKGSGRPSKFTPATRARLVQLIGKGLPFCHASAAVGISSLTLNNWRKDNEGFAQEIEQAVACAIEKRLDVIERASALDPSCAKWQLEHLHPQHFARQRVEITGAGGEPLSLTPLVIAISVSEMPQGKAERLTSTPPAALPPPSAVNVVVAQPIAPKPDCPSPATKEVRPAIAAPEPPPRRFTDLRRFTVRPNAEFVPLSAAEALIARLEARCNPPAPQPPPPAPVPLTAEELTRQRKMLEELSKAVNDL